MAKYKDRRELYKSFEEEGNKVLKIKNVSDKQTMVLSKSDKGYEIALHSNELPLMALQIDKDLMMENSKEKIYRDAVNLNDGLWMLDTEESVESLFDKLVKLYSK